jgi:hypothetical protein
MSTIDTDTAGFSEPPASGRPGPVLVILALVIPVLATAVLFFVTTWGVALAVSAGTVLITALLVAIDARRLGTTDPNGIPRESAALLFVGMCVLWIVFFPYAYFRRRHFTGPNLGVAAICVALASVLGPVTRVAFLPPLPTCTSAEVVRVLDGLLRGMPIGQSIRSIDGYREIRFDREANCRYGQCVAHTTEQDIVVNYQVEWLDRKKRRFAVKIPPPTLPACTSPEVVRLLEQVIRNSNIGPTVQSIDGHCEIEADAALTRRRGQCVAHTTSGDKTVVFDVEWIDRNQGRYSVKLPPAELPLCTSSEVARLIEQVVRNTFPQGSVLEIDDYEEVGFEPEANRRIGHCVVHTDMRDIVLEFMVEWQDRAAGRFIVRVPEQRF